MMQSTLALWTADALRVTPRQLGWIYGYIGVISAVVQGGLTAPLTQRFGPAALLRAGTLLAGVGLAVVPFAGSVLALLVWLTFIGIGTALQNPSYAQLFAAASNPDERGAVLGAYQGSASLGRVIGPFTASGIATLAPLSWPFLVAAVLMGIALVVLRDLGALRAAPAVQPAT
jgi:MFS family permease